MRTFAGLLLLSMALSGAGSSAQAQDLPEALAENFFSPDLVRMAQPALSLTPEQKSTLQEALERIQPQLAETRKRLDKENALLLAMVRPEKLDPDAVMLQADKVTRLEQDARRANLALLLRIRETLTPEQQAKLKEFKSRTAGFQSRVRQAMELAQKWKAEGRDLSAFERSRAQFEALMGAGDFNGAEALLDKTLQMLKQPPKQPEK